MFNVNEIEFNCTGLESKTLIIMPAVRPIKDNGHKATNLFLAFLVNVTIFRKTTTLPGLLAQPSTSTHSLPFFEPIFSKRCGCLVIFLRLLQYFVTLFPHLATLQWLFCFFHPCSLSLSFFSLSFFDHSLNSDLWL